MKKFVISILGIVAFLLLSTAQAATVFFYELKQSIFADLNVPMVVLSTGPILLLLIVALTKIRTDKANI